MQQHLAVVRPQPAQLAPALQDRADVLQYLLQGKVGASLVAGPHVCSEHLTNILFLSLPARVGRAGLLTELGDSLHFAGHVSHDTLEEDAPGDGPASGPGPGIAGRVALNDVDDVIGVEQEPESSRPLLPFRYLVALYPSLRAQQLTDVMAAPLHCRKLFRGVFPPLAIIPHMRSTYTTHKTTKKN